MINGEYDDDDELWWMLILNSLMLKKLIIMMSDSKFMTSWDVSASYGQKENGNCT